MFELLITGAPGTVLPHEWQDETKPIGKATQIYLRALEANGVRNIRAKFDQGGKSIAIPVAELVGRGHAT